MRRLISKIGFSLVLLMSNALSVKAESVTSIEAGASLTMPFFLGYGNKDSFYLNPYLLLSYTPLEKSINRVYKSDLSYELKLATYKNIASNDNDFVLELGAKKRFLSENFRDSSFISSAIMLALYGDYDRYDSLKTKKALQMGINITYGSELKYNSLKNSTLSMRINNAFLTDFRGGWGVMFFVPEAGLIYDFSEVK